LHAARAVLARQRDDALLDRLHVRAVVADEEHDQDRLLPEVVARELALVDGREPEVRAESPERDVLVLGERHAVEVARCPRPVNVWYGCDVTVFVDLPAVRPGRLSGTLVADDLAGDVGDFRALLRDARIVALPDGVRVVVRLDVRVLARLADLVRSAANERPFWSFRLLADPPETWLE